MTNTPKFPLSADDARIAAREDDYAAFCKRVDSELRLIEIARLNAEMDAS